MKYERASGILLHPTSLPGGYGIGDLGSEAYHWVDWLSGAGCILWQILPLGPTGYGDSPYQSFSAFAGNPLLISPDQLFQEGFLARKDLSAAPQVDPIRVDYGLLIPWKRNLLEKAFARFIRTSSGEQKDRFEAYCYTKAEWLIDFALFIAIKDSLGGKAWQDWPSALRERDTDSLQAVQKQLNKKTLQVKFQQYVFESQWNALRAYAGQKHVTIIGDVPIFVAMDSADVWSHPELFFLDQNCLPSVVAGVPPDYFSSTGQLWGNPLYRWDVHKSSGYAWWLERLRTNLAWVDIVRLDHFRGFVKYWEIPAGNPTAEVGRWVPGPGKDFFSQILAGLSGSGDRSNFNTQDPSIIAEDLGFITPDVMILRDEFNFPGMKVLQFAFTGAANDFLPHRYPQHCVVYTGTHDNDTTRGWLLNAPAGQKTFALRYLHASEPEFTREMIRAAWRSIAIFALAPMQDWLDLGSEARLNYPSRLGGNWVWRMPGGSLTEKLQQEIREFNSVYQR